MPCNICGKDQFGPGPNGRMAASKLAPYCRHCGSLERQRIIRRVFQAFPLDFLDRRRALHAGADNALERRWFRSFDEVGRDSALALGTPRFPLAGQVYDLVALSHVLEFIADDRAALRTLCAMLSPRGMLQLCFSAPGTREHSQDFMHAQAGTGVFHLYGRDVLAHFSDIFDGMSALVVEQTDPCTGVRETLHFVFKFRRDAEDALQWLTQEGSARVALHHITASAAAPAASDPFAPLRNELAQWQAAGQPCHFWWRDDDLISADPLLSRLAGLSREFAAPVLVAVIPSHAEANLADATADMPSLVFCQHGYAHINHEMAGAPNSEFGAGRALADLRLDLARGHARLAALFGTRFFPVFVPPWNRLADAAMPFLHELDFIGLSQYADLERNTDPALRIVNAHLDIVAWSTTPTTECRPVPELVAQLVAVLAQQRSLDAGAREPVGLLTHHRVMRDDSWAFVRELLTVTQACGAVRWLAPREVFPPVKNEANS